MPTTPERSPDALKGEIYVSPYALRVKSESIREEMLPPKTHWRQMFDRVVAQVRQVRQCERAIIDELEYRHFSRCQNSPAVRCTYRQDEASPICGSEAEENDLALPPTAKQQSSKRVQVDNDSGV